MKKIILILIFIFIGINLLGDQNKINLIGEWEINYISALYIKKHGGTVLINLQNKPNMKNIIFEFKKNNVMNVDSAISLPPLPDETDTDWENVYYNIPDKILPIFFKKVKETCLWQLDAENQSFFITKNDGNRIKNTYFLIDSNHLIFTSEITKGDFAGEAVVSGLMTRESKLSIDQDAEDKTKVDFSLELSQKEDKITELKRALEYYSTSEKYDWNRCDFIPLKFIPLKLIPPDVLKDRGNRAKGALIE